MHNRHCQRSAGGLSVLIDLHPPRIDFLLPHATWDHPPVRTLAAESEYADWLIAIFDRWLTEGRPVRIRTFDSILSTLHGGASLTEALGLGPTGLMVIETDGSYEQTDSLKAAYDGAPETGMNVFDHALDAVSQHPGILARQQGITGLCQRCQECPVVTSCGGGLYTHRYRTGSGFGNPSVYCPDLLKLISHISSRLPEEPAEAPGSPTHVISGTHFQALAAGFGDGAAVVQLAEAQRSLLRGLLGAVYREGVTRPAVSAAAKVELRRAWSLLTTLDRERPEALQTVLGHPYIRVWAMRCLKQLRSAAAWHGAQDQSGRAPGLIADLGYLGAIAAAAAIRAGTCGTVRIPVVHGAVHLPTLGRLAVGPQEAPGPQDAVGPQDAAGRDDQPAATKQAGRPEKCPEPRPSTLPARWSQSGSATAAGRWPAPTCSAARGARPPQPPAAGPPAGSPCRLRAPGICVALEDTDPYRDCHQWRAAPRLTDTEFAQWQRQFRDAWREIEREHGAYAPALAAGLTTLMPLGATRNGGDLSAAARDAFGTVAVALPADPASLALLLIHQFQHVKLGALLDLYDLYDRADHRLFRASWGEGEHQLGGPLRRHLCAPGGH